MNLDLLEPAGITWVYLKYIVLDLQISPEIEKQVRTAVSDWLRGKVQGYFNDQSATHSGNSQ